MANDDAPTERALLGLTRAQWFALPLELRQRYWKDTDWGNKPPSAAMRLEVRNVMRRQHMAYSVRDAFRETSQLDPLGNAVADKAREPTKLRDPQS